MQDTATVNARKAFDDLEVGDTIEVDQYATPLRVSSDGRHVGMLGVEFVDDKSGASKHLIQNENSGRVYLVAGSTRKGEVRTIDRHV